jgi:hypothetical protein
MDSKGHWSEQSDGYVRAIDLYIVLMLKYGSSVVYVIYSPLVTKATTSCSNIGSHIDFYLKYEGRGVVI